MRHRESRFRAPVLRVAGLALSSCLAACGTAPRDSVYVPPNSTTTAVPRLPDSDPFTPDITQDAIPPLLPLGSLGEEIALRAIALVGKPYRYGGADLHGFDCSGLVYFIHQALGVEVPRTAADQQVRAMPVRREDLAPGDLLFFRTGRGPRISHVGIYVGEQRFVHAPQSGQRIELREVDDDYYRKRLVSAGRLYPVS